MKHYKDKNNEIYAYDDDVSEAFLNVKIKELSLTPLSKKELNELIQPKVDEKETELNEALAYANELKENIRNALILGNEEAINNLRDEYKELLTHIQTLKGVENE